MTAFLSFSGLTGGYGDTNVIVDMSLDVPAGTVVGLFGRNGVGKSTLCRLLQGSLPVRSGQILLDGQNLNDTDAFRRRRAGIGYMAQTGMVFDELTVRENLMLVDRRCDPDRYFTRFPRLQERLDQQAGSMSGGERKILAFVRMMIENTSVLVLDEPSEGVQPENIRHMQDCIIERREDGAAVVLAEQNLSMLMAVSDRYLGIDSGQIVLNKTRQETTREELLTVLEI